MKTSLFENPVEVREHLAGEGTQRIYRFENGYGASVVRFKLPQFQTLKKYGSYTRDETEWELAVIKFNGKSNLDWNIVYDTPIADDVIGYLSEKEVEKVLHKIKAL